MATPENLNNYSLDRDIPTRIWNDYLKKYSTSYKLFKHSDNIVSIRCKHGIIQPYSILQGKLCFYGTFGTPTKKSYFIKKMPPDCEITQLAYAEAVIKFPEAKLADFSGYFSILKRMQLSAEQRQEMAARLKRNLKQAEALK